MARFNISNESFTLVELVIVIVIVGILASLGLTQYGQVIEKSRTVEAKVRIGVMHKNAYQYYMENGTYIGITASDVGATTSCVSTDYYKYGVSSSYPPTDSYVVMFAERCTSGGKPPQFSAIYDLWWKVDVSGSLAQYAYKNTGGSTVVSSNWSDCCK